MSTATIPAQSPRLKLPATPTQSRLVFNSVEPGGQSLRAIQTAGLGIRRRPTIRQGHALELLGHAVEYLVDSRMFLSEEATSASDAEALQVLMLLNRQVFAECAEIVPLTHRLRNWIDKRRGTASC